MILVVDHDPKVIEKAREILNHDRRVFAASSAKNALAMVQRLAFSVALVDFELPGDVAALIRCMHDARPDLPIILISKFDGTAFDAWKSLGVVEVLPKPISAAWKLVVERVRTSHHGH